MVMYFVIAPTGQKFGPADVPTLNAWIQEGRIAPETLLQDAATGAQVVARGIPALKFGFQPTIAAPSSNPYDMPNPVQPPSFTGYQQPWNQPQGVASGQVVSAWLCTFIAPLFMLCYIGLAMSVFGIVTGTSLYREGRTAAGIALVLINSGWIAIYVGFRLAVASGWGPYR